MPPIVTSSRRRRPRKNSPHHILAVISALVFCLLALFYVKLRQTPNHSEADVPTVAHDSSGVPPADSATPPETASVLHPSNPSATQPPAAASNDAPQQAGTPAQPTRPPAPGDALSDRPDALRDLPGRITLPDGNVLTFPPPEPGRTTSISAQGRVYLADSAGNFVDATPPPVFDNALEEQMVGMSTPGGHFIPGLFLANSPDAITNMLHKDVVVYDDDPEDVRAKKEAVAETKQLMLEYLEAGWSLPEIVESLAVLAEQERFVRMKGISAIMRMVREGDIEGARRYKQNLDEVVASQQLSPIILPKRVSDALYGNHTQTGGQP